MKFAVEAVSPDIRVPPHPIEGPMDPGGSSWIADQYTLRLIRDGVIRRKPDEPAPAAAKPAPTASAPSSAAPAKPLPAPAGDKE